MQGVITVLNAHWCMFTRSHPRGRNLENKYVYHFQVQVRQIRESRGRLWDLASQLGIGPDIKLALREDIVGSGKM